MRFVNTMNSPLKIANYIIFAAMANKLKNNSRKKVKADPKKADSKAFKQEKEEKIDWKAVARDERTWKITGAVFLLIAVFLFIAFLSYFFTWKEDQDIAKNGFY